MRTVCFFGLLCLALPLAGCGGSATPKTTITSPQSSPAAFMFTASPNSPTVVSLGIFANSSLSQLPSSPMTLALGQATSLSSDLAGHFVYVWQQQTVDDDTGAIIGENGLQVFRVDSSTGALHDVAGSPMPIPPARLPSATLFSSSLAFTREGANTGVFRQDATTGLLNEVVGSPFALTGQLAATSQTRNLLVTLSAADTSIHTYTLDAAGVPQLSGSATLSGHVGGQALFSRDGLTLLATTGDPTVDSTFGFDIFNVAADGSLAKRASITLPDAAQLAFSSDQGFLYAVSPTMISEFSATGNFAALPGSPMAYAPIGPILAPPIASGNTLLVSEFFHIRTFPIDPAGGTLGAGALATEVPSGSMWLALSSAAAH